MKIYVLRHCYDNGESFYEDRRDYEIDAFFSTQEKAEAAYKEAIARDYVGSWALMETETDTGCPAVYHTLMETPYRKCPSQWDEWIAQHTEKEWDD